MIKSSFLLSSILPNFALWDRDVLTASTRAAFLDVRAAVSPNALLPGDLAVCDGIVAMIARITGSCRLPVGCAVSRGACWLGQ